MSIIDGISKTDMRKFLTAFACLLILTISLLLFFKAIPEGNQDVAHVVLGAAISYVGLTFNYYLGTSQSSNDKDKLLNGKG